MSISSGCVVLGFERASVAVVFGLETSINRLEGELILIYCYQNYYATPSSFSKSLSSSTTIPTLT